MPSSSKSSSKPKPSDVAADAKRRYIPWIRQHMAADFPTVSEFFRTPLDDLPLSPPLNTLRPPMFQVVSGDPVDVVCHYQECVRESSQSRGPVYVPFICAANERRPGGDWETGVVGYEERLCRRSNLSATLAYNESNYPIPIASAILSPYVTVFRGPHDRYEAYDSPQWKQLPVVSLPPARWPKLSPDGTKYSFKAEREVVRNKMRAALRICLAKELRLVAIGDFGLGNGYRNPPEEMAELWREVFLYDPDLRGQFTEVIFVFEDCKQSTTRFILDDLAKKRRAHGGASSSSSSSSASKGKSKSKLSGSSGGGSTSLSSSSSSAPQDTCESDVEIFTRVFDPNAIQVLLSSPDSRYDLNMLMS